MNLPQLHSFEKSLLKHISKKDYLNVNRTIIIAVSGGKDSMALLFAMIKLKYFLKLNFIVAHINHHLRQNSSNDELFVKKFCEENNVELIIEHLDPNKKLKNTSIEEWAREYRYNSLFKISSNLNSIYIFTAHHGNDQIETILFNLSQGSGVPGLRGIHEKRNRVIRPLLSFSKSEINKYIQDMEIPWVEDETNNDLSIPRNFLRKKIVHTWEKENPSLISSFKQVSKNFNDAYESLKFAANMFIPQLIFKKDNDQIHLDEQQLKGIPLYLSSIIFQELTKSKRPWRRHVHNGLHKFIRHSNVGQIYNLDYNWRLLKDRKRFILKYGNNIDKELIFVFPDTKIMLDKFIFSWELLISKEPYNNSKSSEIIDANKIRNKTLTLRLWKKGDRFRPMGMIGTKKLSDYFIDEKINIFSKNNQWLLLDGDRIIWVCGRRISDHIKITSKTTKYGKFLFKK